MRNDPSTFNDRKVVEAVQTRRAELTVRIDPDMLTAITDAAKQARMSPRLRRTS